MDIKKTINDGANGRDNAFASRLGPFLQTLMGVSEEARGLADGVIMIPMRGLTQSLNVSAAASVILHRLSTRRSSVPGAIGIGGEARERFLRRTLEREHDRRVAEQAWWGTDDEGQSDEAVADEG